MAEDFPLMPVSVGGPSAPVETPTTLASPRPQSEGGFGDVFATSYRQSPITTMLLRGYGDLAYGNETIPHDKAVSIVTAQGLDPSFIPKDGIGYGALQEETKRQGEIKLHQLRMERSGGPSWYSSLGGSLAAGVADPSSLVLGPVAGRIAMLARGGLALRAAVGAGEAATYQFGMEAGQAHVTGHDEDISTWQMLHDTTYAALFGGVGGGLFGPRAKPLANMDGYLSMIEGAEGSAAAAKKLGVPINEVRSSAGAVGLYQVTENTARQYGFDPARLTDADYNKQAATTILRDLHKKFGDDPEAIAIGYNAGPGWAQKFIKAGRDRSILPKETQGYLKRIDLAGVTPRAIFGQGVDRAALAARAELANKALDQEPVIGNEEPRSFGAAKLAEHVATPEEEESSRLSQAWESRARTMQASDHALDLWQVSTLMEHGLTEDQARAMIRPQDAPKVAEAALQRFAGDEAAAPSPKPEGTPQPVQGRLDMQAQRLEAAPPAKGSPAEAMTQAVAEARASMPAHMAESFDEAVSQASKVAEAGTQLLPEQFDKAVNAAVRCGVLKGAQYAGD
jgi:hypothetical protein